MDPALASDFVRRLPWVGLALAATWLLGWSVLLLVREDQALATAIGSGLLFYGGKEAGIPAGIAAGGWPWLVGLFIFIADAALVCVAYPFIHANLNRWMARPGWFGSYLREERRIAQRRAGFVARYRNWGLFAFMLVPFAFNGPLVGAIIGRLIGLRSRQIVPTLLLAVAVTTIFWTTVYGLGFYLARQMDSKIPALVVAGVLLSVAATFVVHMIRAHRRNRTSELEPEEAMPPSTMPETRPSP